MLNYIAHKYNIIFTYKMYATIKHIFNRYNFKPVDTYTYLNLSKIPLNRLHDLLRKYTFKELFKKSLRIYDDDFLEYYITNKDLDITYTYKGRDIVYVAILRKNYSLLRLLVKTNLFNLRSYIALVLYLDDPEIVKILGYQANNIVYLSYLQWNNLNSFSSNIVNTQCSLNSYYMDSNIFDYFYELQSNFNSKLFFLAIKRKDYLILEDMLEYANNNQILEGINDALSFGYKDEFILLVSRLNPKINFRRYIDPALDKIATKFYRDYE